MAIAERLELWHKTRLGLLVFGVVELALAYVFISFALDSGSLLDYLFTILFLIGGLHNLTKLIKRLYTRTA